MMKVDKYRELEQLINELKNLFNYKENKLEYNEQIQENVNKYLTDIAILSGTFAHNIKNERQNIRDGLTILDTITGKEVELVDVNSMSDRVKNLLNKNDKLTCLRALALSNKCAHIFDGDIKSIEEIIKKYYSVVYPSSALMDNFSFFDPIESVFPLENNFNLEDLDFNKFKGAYNIIFSNGMPNKSKKISVLQDLKISFDNKNVDSKFADLRNNKTAFVNSYLVHLYKLGQHIVSLQNKMFFIKDEYIKMIGQLLTKDFSDVDYELIQTEGVDTGFNHMLIIDDIELQYYIEVHMPDFIAACLKNEYGLIESEMRITKRLGASAVYERTQKEINQVREALSGRLVPENGQTRAEIITRGVEQSGRVLTKEDSNKSLGTPPGPGAGGEDKEVLVVQGGLENETNDSENYSFIVDRIEERISSSEGKSYNNDREDYSFTVDRIDMPLSLIERFLLSTEKYKKNVEFNREMLMNENYSINLLKDNAFKNYSYIYDNFNREEKWEFITSSLDYIKNGDVYDKQLYKNIINNDYNYEFVGKLLLNESKMKDKFVYDLILTDKINFELLKKDLLDRKVINNTDIKKEINKLININNNIEEVNTLISNNIDKYILDLYKENYYNEDRYNDEYELKR